MGTPTMCPTIYSLLIYQHYIHFVVHTFRGKIAVFIGSDTISDVKNRDF